MALLGDDGLEDRHCQPRLGPVTEGNVLDDGDGLGRAVLAEEELGRLVHGVDDAAEGEHGERDDADGEDEVAPALVGGPVGDEVPGDDGREELADGPPHGEQGEQRRGPLGEQLEEQGAVDGQVAADAEAQGGEEEADPAPGGGVRREDAEDACDDERRVEGDTAAEDVAADAPDGTADAEAEEDSAGGVADRLLVDAELGREGR